MSKKITQAAARQTRRELKALQSKFDVYTQRPGPGVTLSYYIPVGDETSAEIKLSRRLGFDIVYRFDEEKKRLSAYAVHRS